MFVQWTERYSTVEKECLASASLQSLLDCLKENNAWLTWWSLSLQPYYVFTIQYANSVFKFKALRIETEEDVHKLVKFFIRKAEGKRPDTESSLSEDDNSQPQLIHPNEVPQALQGFIERKHAHWPSEWKCPLLCHVKLVWHWRRGEECERLDNHTTYTYVQAESGLNYTK